MRNLIVCCDGTWNSPDQEENGIPTPTNVCKLYNLVTGRNADGVEQVKYYHPGVGAEGNVFQKLTAGAVGKGLGLNVQSAYAWLAANYRPGDRIWLFGFSRGAYTARSVGGMIGRCGLLDLSDAPNEKLRWKRVEIAFRDGYRKRLNRDRWEAEEQPAQNGQTRRVTADQWKVFDGNGVDIHFIGVWDTVGALGVPDDLALLNLLDDPDKYRFHDTDLSKRVKHARHAIALDEIRESYAPTLWTGDFSGQDVKQVWFAGAHSDVGGGYVETQLSDITLHWMLEEAKSCGLGINEEMAYGDPATGIQAQIRPNFQGIAHDPVKGLFGYLKTRPRNTPPIDHPQIHDSAKRRSQVPPISQAPYRNTRRLQVGETAQMPIYARMTWNFTGLFLEAGAGYEFQAEGEWLDKSIPAGPEGTADGQFHMGEVAHLAGSLLGKLEKGWQKVTGNASADILMSRRAEEAPWFSLIGYVANGGNPMPGVIADRPQQFLIGKGTPFTVSPDQGGYLYCFTNDAWNFYENNRGSVMLTVRRVS